MAEKLSLGEHERSDHLLDMDPCVRVRLAAALGGTFVAILVLSNPEVSRAITCVLPTGLLVLLLLRFPKGCPVESSELDKT